MALKGKFIFKALFIFMFIYNICIDKINCFFNRKISHELEREQSEVHGKGWKTKGTGEMI